MPRSVGKSCWHDIACAKEIDARSAGVATGRYSREQLEAANAEFVFDDLADVDGVICRLGLVVA